MTLHQRLIDWFVNGETGLSSSHMAAVAAGVHGTGDWPRDPSDLRRCVQLVRAVPEIKSHFSSIADSGPQWAAIIRNWDELAALVVAEMPNRFSAAARTAARMKSLGL